MREKEKEEKAKLKAAENAKKAAERSASLAKKYTPKVRTTVSKKHKIDEASSSEPNSASKDHVDEDTSVSREKKLKTAKNDDIIDPNQCCLCFRTFEEDEMEKTGMEWVEYVCKRWLHEDCIDYVTNVG